MLSNIFMRKYLSIIFLPSFWISIKTSYNVSTNCPIYKTPQLYLPSSCVLAVKYLMGSPISMCIISWNRSTVVIATDWRMTNRFFKLDSMWQTNIPLETPLSIHDLWIHSVIPPKKDIFCTHLVLSLLASGRHLDDWFLSTPWKFLHKPLVSFLWS